jgi:hypothetical protein
MVEITGMDRAFGKLRQELKTLGIIITQSYGIAVILVGRKRKFKYRLGVGKKGRYMKVVKSTCNT